MCQSLIKLHICCTNQRCADTDILASASVHVRRIASASARFCRQPSVDVRRCTTAHCQMSVTVKQLAYMIIPWYTTPQGTGCLCLDTGFTTNLLFCITYYSYNFNLKFFLKIRALLRNHDFSGVCLHPQLNKILHPCPSTDAQKLEDASAHLWYQHSNLAKFNMHQ